jgi:hypothetical protein
MANAKKSANPANSCVAQLFASSNEAEGQDKSQIGPRMMSGEGGVPLES